MAPVFNVPQQLRKNHERTDDVLCDLGGLLAALDLALYNHPKLGERCDESQAAFTLIALVRRLVNEDLRLTRRQEWHGIGGSPEGLTPEQAAEAREGGAS